MTWKKLPWKYKGGIIGIAVTLLLDIGFMIYDKLPLSIEWVKYLILDIILGFLIGSVIAIFVTKVLYKNRTKEDFKEKGNNWKKNKSLIKRRKR